MDYNTKRDKLIMPEYGRGIQQMVEHCKTIADKDERMLCARTIINTMANMAEQTADREDFQKKLWNHLAAMAQYDLDIDYPVERKHAPNGLPTLSIASKNATMAPSWSNLPNTSQQWKQEKNEMT